MRHLLPLSPLRYSQNNTAAIHRWRWIRYATPNRHQFLSSFFLSYHNTPILIHRQQREKDFQALSFSEKKTTKKKESVCNHEPCNGTKQRRHRGRLLRTPSQRRTLACFMGSIVAVLFVVLNAHLLSDLPPWLILGIVGMAAFILRYGSFQQRPRQAEAESQVYMEERLRRTRSNLPALRVRLALMDRDFDELDYEDLRVLDEGITPDAPSTSEGDTNAKYMVQSHVHTRRTQDNELACIVCLEQFSAGELVRSLACLHQFHVDCVDPWLRREGTCPICKYRVGPGFRESNNGEPGHMV